MKKYKFIDLFAGIGGFHQALTNIGCECVCASETDKEAIKRYKQKFSHTLVVGDINKTYLNLPEFAILCGAGCVELRDFIGLDCWLLTS